MIQLFHFSFFLSFFLSFLSICWQDIVLDRQQLLLQEVDEGNLKYVVEDEHAVSVLDPLLNQVDKKSIVPQTKHTRNLFWSIVNLGNDVISPSIVAFPYFFGASIPVVVTCLAIYGLVNAYTLVLLRKMCVSRQIYTFSELCLVALGRPGYAVAAASVFIFNWLVVWLKGVVSGRGGGGERERKGRGL